MPLKRRYHHKIDWFIFRDEQEKRAHHSVEHNAFASARQEPGGTGPQSIDYLIQMLCDKNEQVRQEAARALEQVDDVMVMAALVKKTQDCDLSVRWAAMNILINVGRRGLRPLLEALTQDFNSFCLRQSARRILQTLHSRGDLTATELEVLRALERRTPAAHIASVANHALIASM